MFFTPIIWSSIKSGNTTIATLTTTNLAFSNIQYESGFYYTNLVYSNDNKSVSFDYLDLTKLDVDYIDQFMYASMESDKTIESLTPCGYLNYDNSTTVKQYLESLSNLSIENFKTLLITTAVNNEDKYYSLINYLLNANVPSNAAELEEFTNLSTTIGENDTPATIYDQHITYNSIDYYYGFTLADNSTFTLAIENPGTISVLSKNKVTNNNGSYSYEVNYTNTTLGFNYNTSSTPVTVSGIDKTDITISEYVQLPNSERFVLETSVDSTNYTDCPSLLGYSCTRFKS